ncbi:MAG: TRAP transporter small permease [Betaproteobacteria bacterium]|nr:TRAP transporter small permease [Betaproteobacteria bacterium]
MAFVWLAYAALFAMTVLTTADAFLRYLFNAPLPGVEELTVEIFMPALVYFSIAYVFRTGGHVRITLVSDLLPARVQRALWCVFDLLTGGVVRVDRLRPLSADIQRLPDERVLSSPLNYVIWPSFAIATIGSALLVVRAVQAAIHPSRQDIHHVTLD